MIGAIFASYALAADLLVDNDIFIFGGALAIQVLGNFTLRMAGVYMLSIGTLWTRSRVMPRWANFFTFILAIGFLFFASSIRGARFLFPAWVFVMSVYILFANRRLRQGKAQNTA